MIFLELKNYHGVVNIWLDLSDTADYLLVSSYYKYMTYLVYRKYQYYLEVFSMNEIIYSVPEFPAENVPVTLAASILGKDQMFIREAMKRGIIDLGVCYQKEGSSQYDIYISPFKLWQLSGYVYKGYEIESRLAEERKLKKKK
jgi:hypothetical protein